MSDQEDNTERRIVEVPSSALLIREEREKSLILSEMVSAALVVAAETGLANLAAEELIRIGKTFYLKDGPGATEANIKAFSFFYQAAQKGSPEADWLVYTCIIEGAGVSFNYKIAIEWLKKACTGGHPKAQYREALAHFYGEYGKIDFDRSIELLESASANGNTDAMTALGALYLKLAEKSISNSHCLFYDRDNHLPLANIAVSENEIRYFEELSNGGDYTAKFNLARILEERMFFVSEEQLDQRLGKSLSLYQEILKEYETSLDDSLIPPCLLLLHRIRDEEWDRDDPSDEYGFFFWEPLHAIAEYGTVQERIDALNLLGWGHWWGYYNAILPQENPNVRSFNYFKSASDLGSVYALDGIATCYKAGIDGFLERNEAISNGFIKSAFENGFYDVMHISKNGVPCGSASGLSLDKALGYSLNKKNARGLNLLKNAANLDNSFALEIAKEYMISLN